MLLSSRTNVLSLHHDFLILVIESEVAPLVYSVHALHRAHFVYLQRECFASLFHHTTKHMGHSCICMAVLYK